MKAKWKLALKETANLFKDTFTNAFEHNLPLHGAAIAFYTIFSIAPLLIIILYLSGLLLNKPMVQQTLFTYIADLIGKNASASLRELANNYTYSGTNFITNIIAIVVLIFGATTVVTQLKASLHTLWGIKESKHHLVKQYVLDRLISFAAIVGLAALFIASLIIEAVTSIFHSFIVQLLPDFLNSFFLFGLPVSTFVIAVLFFAMLFRFLPDIRIPWMEVFIGAAFTALLFIAGKSLITLYLTNSTMQTAYKAAGSFVVFFIWIYYSVQIVLLGAEFTYTLHQKRGTSAPEADQ